jgi:hypothetical protein
MKLRDLIDEFSANLDCELFLLDGLDDALLGTVMLNDDQVVAVYDYQLCIKALREDQGLTYEEAVDYFDFNISRLKLVGGPIFLERHGA